MPTRINGAEILDSESRNGHMLLYKYVYLYKNMDSRTTVLAFTFTHRWAQFTKEERRKIMDLGAWSESWPCVQRVETFRYVSSFQALKNRNRSHVCRALLATECLSRALKTFLCRIMLVWRYGHLNLVHMRAFKFRYQICLPLSILAYAVTNFL